MKILRPILILLIILTFTAMPIVTSAAEDFEIGQTPMMAKTEGDTLNIDGNVDLAGEVWADIPRTTVDAGNSYTAWSGKSRVVTENDIRFAYDNDYLYLACTTYDDSFVPSTAVIPGDEHGFDGDTVIFQFDPLKTVVNSVDPQVTATWYCFSISENGQGMVYRTYCGALDGETEEIVCAGSYDDNSWTFEAMIPWSLIASDLTAQTGLEATVEDMATMGMTHNAKLIYMNRYIYGSGDYDDMCDEPPENIGDVMTICRSFTPCNVIPNTEYPGYAGNPQQTRTCGIYLYTTDHLCEISDEWIVSNEGSCDTKFTEIRPCVHCGRAMDTREGDYVHDWNEEWSVIKEPTCADGLKAILCNGCGKQRESAVIPAVYVHEESDENIIYAINFNEYTEKYELYCERCGADVDTTASNIHRLFTDVAPDKWYSGAVAYSYTEGIMSGVSKYALIFEPEVKTTRAMLVTVLGRLQGIDTSEYGAAPFDDVAPDKWYTPYISWAVQEGYAYGYSETTFGPNDTLTREQAVTMLYRFAKDLYNPDLSVLEKYTDNSEVSDFAKEAVCWAIEKGIIKGSSGVTLSPKNSTTRAELARIMMGFKKSYN